MAPASRAVLTVAVLIVVAAFGLLCAFDRPSIDDYWIAVLVRDEGFLDAQVRWYTQWHGKFFGMAAMSAFAWAFDIVHTYWVAPALVLAAMWVGCLCLARALSPGLSRLSSLAAATALFAFYAAHVPEPHESIYWMTGAYAYQAGIVCALLLVASLAASVRTPVRAAMAGLLALAVTGSSETLMLPVLTLAGAWVLAAWTREVAWTRFGLVVAVAVGLGAAVMVLAPGNAVRSAHVSEQAHDLARALTKSLGHGAKYCARWTANPALWGASLLFAGPLCALAVRYRRPVGVLGVLGVYLLVCVACFPAHWATGYGPPPRARAAVWAVFAVGWFFVVVPGVARACRASGRVWSERRRATVGAFALAVGLFVPGNTLAAVGDLASGRAAAFRRECAARDACLREAPAAGARSVAVQSLAARPATLFVDDFASAPDDWRNGGAAAYYGIAELRAVAQ
jgi:hypothetical protein